MFLSLQRMLCYLQRVCTDSLAVREQEGFWVEMSNVVKFFVTLLEVFRNFKLQLLCRHCRNVPLIRVICIAHHGR